MKMDKPIAKSTSQESGIRYIELLWKTIRDEMPHRLDRKMELSILVGISRTYDITGHWKRALEAYQQARELAADIDEREIEANLFRWMGHIHRLQGDWQEAVRCNNESMEICRRIDSRTGRAYACNNLGAVYFETGDMQKARESFEESLTIAEEEDEARLMAQANNNLAILSQEDGDLEEAVVRYRNALVGYEREGDIRGMAQTHYNLTLAFEEKGDGEEFLKNLEMGMDLAGDIDERDLQAMLHLRRAEMLTGEGDLPGARSFVDLALEIFSGSGDRVGMADAYRMRGVVCHRQGADDEFRESFQKSIDLHRQLEDERGLANALRDYGICWKEKEDRAAATEALNESRALLEKLNELKKVREVQGILDEMLKQ